MTPIKAIRLHCLECSGGSSNEVKLCVIPDCRLYPFRLGKNPNVKKREYTEEQRAEMRERAKRNLLSDKTRSYNREEYANAPSECSDTAEEKAGDTPCHD